DATRNPSSGLPPFCRRFLPSSAVGASAALASLSSQVGFSFNPSLTNISTQLPEPIGTVDLLTITRRRSQSSARPMACATDLTWDRSALPLGSGGVPTAMKMISDSLTGFQMSVENLKLPRGTALAVD